MGHAKVKDEQFRVIEDVVRGRDTFVSLPTGCRLENVFLYLFPLLSFFKSIINTGKCPPSPPSTSITVTSRRPLLFGITVRNVGEF